MSSTAELSPADRLQERLNDPKVAEGLNRLLNQLDIITFAVESADGFLKRGEVITDSLAEGVAEMRAAKNPEFDELLQKAPQMLKTGTQLADAATEMDVDELSKSKILERLTNPETLATLNQLLDKLPLVAFMLESLDGFVRRGETITDNLAGMVGELKLHELDMDLSKMGPLVEALPKLAAAGEKVLDSELLGEGLPKVIDAGVMMIESGMLDKEVVRVLGDLGKKGVDTYEEVSQSDIQPVGGIFSLLRAMNDPDVKKSMGFGLAFAKAFAKHLK